MFYSSHTDMPRGNCLSSCDLLWKDVHDFNFRVDQTTGHAVDSESVSGIMLRC